MLVGAGYGGDGVKRIEKILLVGGSNTLNATERIQCWNLCGHFLEIAAGVDVRAMVGENRACA